MNDARRKEINRARDLIEQAKDIIETTAAEERDYYDNMPENMQGSDKGTKAEETADALDEIAQSLEEATSNIDTATE